MWYQYNITDFHGMTNIISMCGLHLHPHRIQGVQLYKFHIQTTVLCVFGQVICDGGVIDREYLGLFLHMVEHGSTVLGYI